MPDELVHDWIYDFDEDLNLVSITRNYYTSYEAMNKAHEKFNAEHPDIAERRERGMEKMLEDCQNMTEDRMKKILEEVHDDSNV